MCNRYYFAYGSNLNHGDWERFCRENSLPTGLLKFHAIAYLPDHDLAFTYRSTSREGGVLDVRPRIGQAVAGVIFEVAEGGWKALDKKEGHPKYYVRTPVTVIMEDGRELDAITYCVVEEWQQDYVKPTPEYVEIVREGLSAYELPDAALDAAAVNEPTPWFTDGLFAYGTLMRGEIRFDILKPFGIQCALLALCHGRLFDLGNFPGLVEDDGPGEMVEGEFIRLKDIGGALARLDVVEGYAPSNRSASLFVRTLRQVDVGEGRIRWAWTYRYNRTVNDVREIATGSWRVRCGRRESFLRDLVAAHAVGDEPALARAVAGAEMFAASDAEPTMALDVALGRGAVSERKLAQASGKWDALC